LRLQKVCVFTLTNVRDLGLGSEAFSVTHIFDEDIEEEKRRRKRRGKQRKVGRRERRKRMKGERRGRSFYF
jgi:hypothetical protein